MVIHYTETNSFRIVPKYQGLSPVGFDVVDKDTNDVVVQTRMLYEAEEFILSSRRIMGGSTVGSAAEVEHY